MPDASSENPDFFERDVAVRLKACKRIGSGKRKAPLAIAEYSNAAFSPEDSESSPQSSPVKADQQPYSETNEIQQIEKATGAKPYNKRGKFKFKKTHPSIKDVVMTTIPPEEKVSQQPGTSKPQSVTPVDSVDRACAAFYDSPSGDKLIAPDNPPTPHTAFFKDVTVEPIATTALSRLIGFNDGSTKGPKSGKIETHL
ncbi:hypothetical protein RLOatenuis_7880 [Rickettsiales bacterium]|nr:hypothetical protein RLOatenuis_7880 [Rickettsiales bacterium]